MLQGFDIDSLLVVIRLISSFLQCGINVNKIRISDTTSATLLSPLSR